MAIANVTFMTPRISELLERAASRTVPVVRRITDDQLAAPTPCGSYDVRELTGHLHMVVVNFRRLAAKEDADFGKAPIALEGDWRDDFAAEVAGLVAAWSAPDAEEGTAGAMAMPARTVGVMALGDLTVHGWELARATGQPYPGSELGDSVLEALDTQYAQLVPTARKMGVFGEPVPVGEDAGPFERLLGLVGRDPAWRR